MKLIVFDHAMLAAETERRCLETIEYCQTYAARA